MSKGGSEGGSEGGSDRGREQGREGAQSCRVAAQRNTVKGSGATARMSEYTQCCAKQCSLLAQQQSRQRSSRCIPAARTLQPCTRNAVRTARALPCAQLAWRLCSARHCAAATCCTCTYFPSACVTRGAVAQRGEAARGAASARSRSAAHSTHAPAHMRARTNTLVLTGTTARARTHATTHALAHPHIRTHALTHPSRDRARARARARRSWYSGAGCAARAATVPLAWQQNSAIR